jgi:hypothetical protein
MARDVVGRALALAADDGVTHHVMVGFSDLADGNQAEAAAVSQAAEAAGRATTTAAGHQKSVSPRLALDAGDGVRGLMTRRKQWLIWVAVIVLVLAAIGYLVPEPLRLAGWLHLPRRVRAFLADTFSFLADTFSDSTRIAAAVSVLSAVFALCSLLVQLFVGNRQANASRISADAAMLTAKSSGNRAVASMRIKWVEDLRAVLSEYHSMLMTRENFEGADRTLMSNLGTKLDLMMNLNEPDQKALWDVADKIYFEEDLEKRRGLDPALMDAGRLVLKNEWEKIKRELRGD